MRTLGIDYGTKRIGLALSDETGKWATPYDRIETSSAIEAQRRLGEVIRREGVGLLVVGLPLNMDGSFGPSAKAAVAFGRALAEFTGTSLHFVDERLSSFEAEQQFIRRKQAGEHITRQQKKTRLDAVAAAGFLQSYLDGKLPPIEL